MAITLRKEYQVPFVDSIRAELVINPKAHIACNLVGGGGKTIIFTWLAMRMIENGWKVFVFSDRTELITQASGAFSKFGVKHSFINPKAKFPDYDATATLCSSQTFRRRIEKEEWRNLFTRPKTMVIIDEADRQEFNYLFISGLFDEMPVLGFSGTFARSGHMRQLGFDYDVIVKGVAPMKLVELGFLVMDRYFAVSEPDMSDVAYDAKSGDYNPHQVFQKFNKKEMYQGMIHNYFTHTPNTKVLGFGANQIHSVYMAAEFQKNGIESKYLISGIPKPKKPEQWKNEGQRVKYERSMELYLTEKQFSHLTGNRTKVLNDFREGKIQGLMNAGLFGTGLDVPDLETVIINKSTMSLREYLQISWRVGRISPETGKVVGNIIDMANHAHREDNPLGRCLDDRTYGLWHEESKGGGIVSSKLCDPNKEDKNKRRGCNRLINIGAKMCRCGFIFATEKELKEMELKEIAYEGAVPEEVLIKTMNTKQLFAHRKLKKYKMGWLIRQLLSRGDDDYIYSEMKSVGYSRVYTKRLLSYVK